MQEIKLNEDETSHFKKKNYQHTIQQKKTTTTTKRM